MKMKMFVQLVLGTVVISSAQVSCKTIELQKDQALEQSSSVDFGGYTSYADVQVHSRKRRSLDSDACHVLANTNIQNSKASIKSAWANSTEFLLNVSTAVDNIKQCPSWNIFKAATCFIKGILEVRRSYVSYKPQIYDLIEQISANLMDLRSNFVDCAKLLLLNDS